MVLCKSKYSKRPPTGSVLGNATKLVFLGIKKNGLRNIKKDIFWDSILPSRIEQQPGWMTQIDDNWVRQVRRGLAACG